MPPAAVPAESRASGIWGAGPSAGSAARPAAIMRHKVAKLRLAPQPSGGYYQDRRPAGGVEGAAADGVGSRLRPARDSEGMTRMGWRRGVGGARSFAARIV